MEQNPLKKTGIIRNTLIVGATINTNMKKLFFLLIIAAGICSSLNAQSVNIASAKVINVPGNNALYVTGTLQGTKGIPVSGYSVDVTDVNGKKVRIVTNVASGGGFFSYAGLIPAGTQLSANPVITVTMNRGVNATAKAATCSCK